jgi:hypothetical protein
MSKYISHEWRIPLPSEWPKGLFKRKNTNWCSFGFYFGS